MACKSGSVEKAVKKTDAALVEVDHLHEEIKKNDQKNKTEFYRKIDEELKDANITDAIELTYNSEIKTEYASEFNLDKIAAVVAAALKVAAAVAAGGVATAMAPLAIQAYTDLVNSVAEAAKSKSSAATSLSFSMTRLSPGLLGFLYAWSVNVSDEDTFGKEAVTSTAIYYRLMQSISDLNSQTEFIEASIDSQNLLHMKILQAALTDQLAKGTLSIEDWEKRDAMYSAAVETIRKRLKSNMPKAALVAKGVGKTKNQKDLRAQQLVKASIKVLSARKSRGYKAIVVTLQQRLKKSYY